MSTTIDSPRTAEETTTIRHGDTYVSEPDYAATTIAQPRYAEEDAAFVSLGHPRQIAATALATLSIGLLAFGFIGFVTGGLAITWSLLFFGSIAAGLVGAVLGAKRVNRTKSQWAYMVSEYGAIMSAALVSILLVGSVLVS